MFEGKGAVPPRPRPPARRKPECRRTGWLRACFEYLLPATPAHFAKPFPFPAIVHWLHSRQPHQTIGFSMSLFKALSVAAFALASTAADAQQTLRVGYIPVMGVAQIFVAEGEGCTKQGGITLKTAAFESGPNMI